MKRPDELNDPTVVPIDDEFNRLLPNEQAKATDECSSSAGPASDGRRLESTGTSHHRRRALCRPGGSSRRNAGHERHQACSIARTGRADHHASMRASATATRGEASGRTWSAAAMKTHVVNHHGRSRSLEHVSSWSGPWSCVTSPVESGLKVVGHRRNADRAAAAVALMCSAPLRFHQPSLPSGWWPLMTARR